MLFTSRCYLNSPQKFNHVTVASSREGYDQSIVKRDILDLSSGMSHIILIYRDFVERVDNQYLTTYNN